MRPTNLVISAFGPYADKTVLQMDLIGKKGIYVIAGDTGAGKTTIFDAIVFALFGEASGTNRANEMLRSEYASDNTPTYVELEFEYAGKHYKITRNPEYQRISKRGGKTTAQKAQVELILPCGKVITKIKDVDIEIKNILGIDRAQFSQIAMIAQGDFLKLLVASTEDRKKIFRDIFKTKKFFDLQEKLKRESGTLERECKNLENSISQYFKGVECGDSDLLKIEVKRIKEGLISTSETVEVVCKILENDTQNKLQCENKLQLICEQISRVKNIINQHNKNMQIVTDLENSKKLREQSKIKLEEKQLQLNSLKQQEEKQQNNIAEIFELKNEIKKMQDIFQKIDKLKDLELGFIKIKNDIKIKDMQLAKKLDEVVMLSKQKEELKNCEVKKEQLSYRFQIYSERLKKTNKLIQSILEFSIAEKALENKQQEFVCENDLAQKLRVEFDFKNNVYLKEQAGVLALNLHEGQSCPVCGSTSHPKLASVSEEVISQAMLNELKCKVEKQQLISQKLSSEAGMLKGQMKQNQMNIQCCIEEVEPFFKIEDNCRNDVFKLEKNAKHMQCETSNIISQIDKEIRVEQSNIVKKMMIEEQHQKALSDVEMQKEYLNSKNSEIAVCEANILANKQDVENLKGKLKFQEQNVVERRIINLQKENEQFKKQFDECKLDVENLAQKVSELDGQIQILKVQAVEFEKIDINQKENEYNELVKMEQRQRNLIQELFARIKSNKQLLENVKKQSEILIKTEKKSSMMKSLSDTANGAIKGKEKIMLETYIQMAYFDRIIARANSRFMKMSAGKFELVRKIADFGNQSQSGLELNIIDHYNGSERSVKTLSGGESFMASLSLALGLSDEIQASAGGVKLDTMFIDEGFGSLSDEPLELAIRVLSDLTEGNRLVGIISHITSLKERIDKQIVVTKTKNGSSIAKIMC